MQRSLDEQMRLAEARKSNTHAQRKRAFLSAEALNKSTEEMHPNRPLWKRNAPNMRLVEVQCAHRKDCYPQMAVGDVETSHLSSRGIQELRQSRHP